MKLKYEIIEGEVFGNLTIIKEISPHIKGKRKHRKVQALCTCGNITEVIFYSLISGNTTSCGCNNFTHRLTNCKLYTIWSSMKQRCYDKNSNRYKDWGGRGITICDSWKNNFKEFYDWSNMNGYLEGLQLERKNNDLGYFPENCTFVGRKEQCNNRRNNIFFEYEGNMMTLPMICKKLNLQDKYNLIRQRISRDGKSLEKALIF